MTRIALIALAAALALAGCGEGDKKSAEAPAPAGEPAATTAMMPGAPSAEAAVPNPYAGATFSDAKLQAGHDVFQKWCAPCHAPGPGNPGTQALAVKYKGTDVPAVLEERTDLTPDLTKTFVRGGVSIMPPFRKTEVSDADLDALAAYLARPR